MRTKQFNKIKPYTYFIKRKSDNLKYHGVRFRNKVSPLMDLGKYYFGSSKDKFCSDFKKNKSKFEYRIIWTFDSEQEAINHETKINKKIYKRRDWVNRAAYPAILIDEEVKKNISRSLKGKRKGKNNHFFGKSHSKKSLSKMRKSKKGKKTTGCHVLSVIFSNLTRKYSAQTLKKISKINKGKKFPKKFGKKISLSRQGMRLSEIHKKNIGLGVKGEKNGMFGKTHSFQARKKISISKLGKIPWNKGKKYKTGNIPWNKGINWKRKINRKEVSLNG